LIDCIATGDRISERQGSVSGLITRVSASRALAEAGLPVICVETRHMRAVLRAQINKTDRNDARGIAQMMRVAWGSAIVTT
jgi:hypothetical protein